MPKSKPNGYWNKARCIDAAKSSKTLTDFQKTFPGAYDKCRDSGWMAEVGSILGNKKCKYTDESVREIAKSCKTKGEFRAKSSGAYNYAWKSGILDSVCSHMPRWNRPNKKWSAGACREEAARYSSRFDFQEGSAGAYNAAYKNGWLEDICSHMERRKSDLDVFYIWSTGMVEGERTLCKVGRTGSRTTGCRIRAVSDSSGMSVEWSRSYHAGRYSSSILERGALSMGKIASLGEFTGSSEFRWFTTAEIESLIARAESLL